ncbi:MAG: hypothetical protein AMXMBFR48_03710 [Ignavibacteriales bacterium]|jgi:anti-anti-sigma factor
MNYTTAEENGILTFSLFEKKLDTAISGLLKGEMTTIFGRSTAKGYILHLPDVESCDSSGLSALLVAKRLVHEKNGVLRIVTESSKIRNLITITRLDEVLSVCGSTTQAREEIAKAI